jgi:hypothetical protein
MFRQEKFVFRQCSGNVGCRKKSKMENAIIFFLHWTGGGGGIKWRSQINGVYYVTDDKCPAEPTDALQ